VAHSPTAARWKSIEESTVGLMREVDKLKRDLANAKDQAQRDQEKMLLELLELMDAFDRIFANIEPRLENADRQARIWVGNFRTVRRILDTLLKKKNVAPIEAPEGIAIPGLHTIIETRDSLDLSEGTILEETLGGYLWQGKVLRKALVVAVKN
jgi:molecular chaperone GrpE (heat shock protein)